ncbi:MAG TPA: cysteine desulfurase NifS [Anaerovoracaceae bacterium]|nr:cysteine desulfurase NifS [Anaerovoracaceae bacterium]
MRVYADNAATTKMSDIAIETMVSYMKNEYGNPSSLYEKGQTALEAIERARKSIAEVINSRPKEIYFTSGGSESDNQAIITGAEIGKKKNKRHIITTAFEHHAVLHSLEKLKKQGFDITLLPVYEDGLVRPEDLEKALNENTVMVSVMFANNEIGTIQPIKELGAICREKGVIFHTDAVQALGHLKIDIEEMNIDMLSMSAHKFHGPKGVGALFVRKGIRVSNLIEGGAQEKGKRAGTENVPGIMSMAAALLESVNDMEEKGKGIASLRNQLIEELIKIPHSKVNGSVIDRLPGNLNMCFEGIEGESLLLLLDDKGVSASSGSACTSGSLDPSHVLLAIGLPHEIAHGSLRISLSEYSTKEDIKHIAKVVPEVVSYLRSISPIWNDLKEGRKEYVI